MTKRRSPSRSSRGHAREVPTENRAARRVSATEAARSFSELLNRVRYRGETFIIERGGESICEIRPTGPARFTGADLMTLLHSLPAIDEDYLDAVEEVTRTQPLLPESPWER